MDAQPTFEKKLPFRRSEPTLCLFQTDILRLGNFLKRLHYFQVPMLVFEVWRALKTVIGGNNPVFFRSQDTGYLTAIPYIELTVLVVGIGIQG